MQQSEIRVSPEGNVVAIRNLDLFGSVSLKWRATDGSYLSDKQVEDWTSLNRPIEIHLVKVGEYEDARTIAAFPTLAMADDYVQKRQEFANDVTTDVGETTKFYPSGYSF